ncbi:unnamed protein product [Effrenium voratum]|uniref:Kinesin motor domain-containing protein n=1 Tax=Effrenium voratum TaxID=2562239 RepID=A0AA36I732_9DINO|nr:unnamed protein product [Effrenium voratum]
MGLAIGAVLALVAESYRLAIFSALSYVSSQLLMALRPDVVRALASCQEDLRFSAWARCKNSDFQNRLPPGGCRPASCRIPCRTCGRLPEDGQRRALRLAEAYVSCFCGACHWYIPKAWLESNAQVFACVRFFRASTERYAAQWSQQYASANSLRTSWARAPNRRTRDLGSDWSQLEEDAGDTSGEELLLVSADMAQRMPGQAILDNAMDGFNNTLFAYGQTGSGKTHSVLGAGPKLPQPVSAGGSMILQRIEDFCRRPDEARILQDLFRRVGEQKSEAVEFQCHVSYLEIYNEQIRDLLIPMTEKPPKLTVRHHPKLGIYVAGLTTNAAARGKKTKNEVTSYSDVQSILDFGTKARSVAATNMQLGANVNSASSRSHCIFNFTLLKREGSHEQRASSWQEFKPAEAKGTPGSERQKKTGASGSQLKEGAMINQPPGGQLVPGAPGRSLSNLALVINKLASSSDEGKADFVPFRNSKLTHILPLGYAKIASDGILPLKFVDRA